MKAVFLGILAVLFGMVGCGLNQPVANVPPVEAQTNSTPAAKPAPEKSPAQNDCKICEFDFAAYKGQLNKDEINGLLLALNDEYMATAIYEQVNKDFKDPLPFVNIVEAEKQHANRLKAVFKTYDVPIPENPWLGKVEKFTSVAEACKAGVDAEIINRDLYKKLFESTKREDILLVYRALQRASEQNHLPAFERCASGGMGQGRGPGKGRPW